MNQIEKFEKFKSEFNDFLLERIPKTNNVLHKAIRYSLENGGKRFRAYLLFIVGKHFKYSKHQLYSLGSAIEMIHAYSLVHDDLPCMDNDDLRRGKKTCHKKFDEAQALLVGDALQSMAFQLLSSDSIKVSSELKLKCIHLIANSIGPEGMVLGQSLDMLYEKKKPNKKILEMIHSNKTGKLISACILIPALLSNQPKSQYNNFSPLAKLLGLLYQMIDDYLDATSNKTILGKNPGNDLNTKKITYFSLYGQKKLKEIIEINFKEIVRLAKNLKLPTEFNFLITEMYGRIE